MTYTLHATVLTNYKFDCVVTQSPILSQKQPLRAVWWGVLGCSERGASS